MAEHLSGDYSTILGDLVQVTESRILLIVMDGLGDMRSRDLPRTPLEAAQTPELDRLAKESALGRLVPVLPGITPGSGPGHLALFGYDPIEVQIGRGVLEAVGLDVPLAEGDMAARGNFCTLDASGKVSDRRAGRIPTEKTQELCARIREAVPAIDGCKVIIEPGMSHRFCVVFRGKGLSADLTDADPQKEGKPVPPVRSRSKSAAKTAKVVNRFIERVGQLLRSEAKANGVLLRGFSKKPEIPSMKEKFGLEPTCIATYPMYRGLARLVGMAVEKVEPPNMEGEKECLLATDRRQTFVYFHWKATDQAGEDGNFDQKVAAIEQVDKALPVILGAGFDALAISGDHSSPVPMKGHSWHPVPVLVWAKWGGGDGLARFTETSCNGGSLGIIPMKCLMPLLLAHAMKLKKYGA